MRCASPHKHVLHVYAGENHHINGFKSVYAAGPLCGVTVHLLYRIWLDIIRQNAYRYRSIFNALYYDTRFIIRISISIKHYLHIRYLNIHIMILFLHSINCKLFSFSFNVAVAIYIM